MTPNVSGRAYQQLVVVMCDQTIRGRLGNGGVGGKLSSLDEKDLKGESWEIRYHQRRGW